MNVLDKIVTSSIDDEASNINTKNFQYKNPVSFGPRWLIINSCAHVINISC